jgi:hypothetical protein
LMGSPLPEVAKTTNWAVSDALHVGAAKARRGWSRSLTGTAVARGAQAHHADATDHNFRNPLTDIHLDGGSGMRSLRLRDRSSHANKLEFGTLYRARESENALRCRSGRFRRGRIAAICAPGIRGLS